MIVTVSEPATIALRTLGEDDRRRVTAWFDHLKNWESDEYVRSRSTQLASDESTYVLRTGSDLMVFFSIQNGSIEIVDIARKAALRSFEHATE